jgi:hypothetical protein
MRLVGVAAEDRGNAQGAGVVDEPPKPHDPLMVLGAKSAVPHEEAAKVSARQPQGFGGLINGPVAKQLEGARDLNGGHI